MAIDIRLREEDGGVRVVVGGELDLSGVDFFDSTGLQIRLDADVRARADGHRLVVVAGNGEAARVLELTQVASRFTSAVVE